MSGGELPDDHSMCCYECERVVHRRHISYHPVHMPIDGGPDYERVSVPICEDCARRRYGLECPNCGEYHWDAEAIFECKRDRPRAIPDGGWWICPAEDCDGETEVVTIRTRSGISTTRQCTECDWSVEIPRLERRVTDGGTSTGGSELCPNCRKVGSHQLSASEAGTDVHEFRCNNENCRVAYYEVAA